MVKNWILGGTLTAILASVVVYANSPAVGDAKNNVSRDGVNAALKNEERSDEPTDELVVHEWGTFTTFSGKNGIQMEFRANVDDALPYFVYDRARQAGVWRSPFSKARTRGRVRMETPITYFYTDSIRSVDVSVAFPNGLLTEFYPPVKTMEPPFGIAEVYNSKGSFGIDVAELNPHPNGEQAGKAGTSVLNWGTLNLIPPKFLSPAIDDESLRNTVHAKLADRLAPQAVDGEHYTAARVPESAFVHIHLPEQPKAPQFAQGDYFEKFLFYRGIGGFNIPLQMTAKGGGEFALTNAGSQAFTSLLLVSNQSDGLKFSLHPSIAPGQDVTLTLPEETQTLETLSNTITAELVKTGLYEAEAKAMVATWHHSWFQERGTRLFYLLPQTMTDELLPLSVQPSPTETVRVMVGRYEILTPEDEAVFLQVINKGLAAEAPPALSSIFAARKRFAAPALEYMAASMEEGALKAETLRLRDAATAQYR